MRIAYLACCQTLPGAPERSVDAFEHDQMVDCLSPVFASHGAELVVLGWEEDGVDWGAFDAVLLGSTWNYQDHLDDFLARLADIEGATRLFNARDTVIWNSRKTYLRDLEAKGAAIVPTLWLDQPNEAQVAAAFDRLDTEDLIIKRQIGANAEGQYRLTRSDPVPALQGPMMAQPFLAAIQSEGEMSMIFIDGTFSHALIKSPVDGDYRIQSTYGGRNRVHHPSDADRQRGASILASLDEMPLYARVDMVRDDSGKLRLMELELIEPFLYPLQTEGLGERLYHALASRLAKA